jgi:hypothetical protein
MISLGSIDCVAIAAEPSLVMVAIPTPLDPIVKVAPPERAIIEPISVNVILPTANS